MKAGLLADQESEVRAGRSGRTVGDQASPRREGKLIVEIVEEHEVDTRLGEQFRRIRTKVA